MICRVCLKETPCPLGIFDSNGKQLGLVEILQLHLCFEIKPEDPISTVICGNCWAIINEFHQFYLAVKQAHVNFESVQIKDESDDEKEFCEISIKTEISDSSGEDEVAEMRNPLDEKETVEVTPKTDDEVLENVRVTKRRNKATAANKTLRNEKPRRKTKCVKEKYAIERNSSVCDEEKPKLKSRKSKSSKQDEEIVQKHVKMGCDLCTFVAKDFTEMCKHFRIQHAKVKPYVVCCNTKLIERLRVVEHAYKHENPDYFKCIECNKVFSGSSTLRFHMLTTHAPEEELPFSCDQCNKKFPRKKLLDLHKPSHIPVDKRTFVCDQCPNNKAYASNYLLKLHISMRHRRAVNVCHVCAKEIRDKNAFEKHVRSHFGESGPRLKCPRPDCDSWLKDEENLRKHVRRHNEEGQNFTCTECGNSYKNGMALRNHKYAVHPKDVFTCEECNKSFKRAISLKEHMTQHTGERLYDCPFCKQTFNSKANMYSHKKKRHPVEWDIWRRKKMYGDTLLNEELVGNKFKLESQSISQDMSSLNKE